MLICFLLPLGALAALSAQAQEKSSWAVDVFLHADHFRKNSRLNERNFGLGIKYYHPDILFGLSGRFFAEAGALRNSQKGTAHFVGVGYTHDLFRIGDLRFSGSISPVYVDYGARGRSATATVILPSFSIGYGKWAMNVVYFRKHDGGFSLFSIQREF